MSSSHFSKYVNQNNIVIVPTVSFCEPQTKRQKPNPESQPITQSNPVLPIEVINKNYEATFPAENFTNTYTLSAENTTMLPIQNINQNSLTREVPSCKMEEDANSNNLEDSEQRVKKTLSWASNYLQSIGHSQPKNTKLTNSAYLKFFPQVVENRQQNTNKNPLKPNLKPVDIAHSYNTNTNKINDDRNYPIKINILHSNSYSNSNNNETDIQCTRFNTPEVETDRYAKEPYTPNLKKGVPEKNTERISPANTKLLKNKVPNKEKLNTNIKNMTSKSDKNVSVQRYTEISNNKNKDSKESTLPAKNNNDVTYKTKYKSKGSLEASTSQKIESNFKKPSNTRDKDRLATRSSNGKTYKVTSTHFKTNKSPSKYSRSGSQKEKVKIKSKEEAFKKDTSNDHKRMKSKLPEKHDNSDHKNNSKQTNKNITQKTSETPYTTHIKSVVQVANNFDLDNIEDLRSKLSNPESDHNVKDLRTKLKRKYQNSRPTKRDNLVITVQNDNSDQEDTINKKPTNKVKPKSEKKTRRYKKIKLTINVVCEDSTDSSESDADTDSSKNNEENAMTNVDLSFLDDFNVDDIVDSLNDQENKVNVNISPSKTKDSTTIMTENIIGLKNEELQNDVKYEDNKDTIPLNRPIHIESSLKTNIKMEPDDEKFTNNNLQNTKNETNCHPHISERKIQTQSNVRDLCEKVENTELKTINELDSSLIEQKTFVNNNNNDRRSSNITYELSVNVHNLDTIDEKSSINNKESDLHSSGNAPENTNICSTTLDQKVAKDMNTQNNIKIKNIDSQINVANLHPEKQIPTGAYDVVIIDLTRKQPAHECSKTHSTGNISDSQILKPHVKKVISQEISVMKDIIDLTASGKTKTDLTSIVQTSTQQQSIRKLSPNSDIKLQPKDEEITKSAVITTNLPPPEHNKTQESYTNHDIIDLTIPTTKADINTLTPGNQQLDMKAKEISEEINNNNKSNSSNNVDQLTVDKNITGKRIECEINNRKKQKTEAAVGQKQCEINKELEINNIAKNIDVVEAPVAETSPSQEQNETNCNALNDAEIKDVTPTTIANHASIGGLPGKSATNLHQLNSNHTQLTVVNVPTTKEDSATNDVKKKAHQQIDCNQSINKKQQVIAKDVNLTKDCAIKQSITDNLIGNVPSSKEPCAGIPNTKECSSNDTKKSPEAKPTDNRNKSNSSVTAKPNGFLIALENRMMKYFGKKYIIEFLINDGKFSSIYQCKDVNGRNHALKVFNKGQKTLGWRTEQKLKELQKDIPRKNYNCVFVIDGFAMLDSWCLLMDYYPKNMQQVMRENGKCFHIDVVQTLARQLVSAVLILRNNNLMHLDIKPSHILMNTSNDRLKLAGFEDSQYLQGLSVLPCVGTVNYRPPEVILGFPYFGKIDVWSTALVIYEMCTNRQLFPGCFNNDILYKQMCTLGNIPSEMVMQSVFTNKHFRGGCFARRYGPAWEQCVLVSSFKKSMRLPTSLFKAYNRDWGKLRTRRQKAEDSEKLSVLRNLLQEMLMLDPSRRTPIEFVYANSFIYETFDSCVL